ncbi:NUDIX hydrolase domain-like protein [Powellomyces hirtus]|nr:NUDIX hydrolase domain-like protein [Powellomyces hirtus]
MASSNSEALGMSARQGREKQVYNAEGGRIVVGVVPIIQSTGQIVLVTSRKKSAEWLLPKGGWENDETQAQAAAREAHEESGIIGDIPASQPLGTFPHIKMFPVSNFPTCEFVFYEMHVTKLLDEWPEGAERKRDTFTYDKALELLKNKPYMRDAVLLCSLAPAQK